ncbi:histidine phosphatase family protein [Legionella nagasakiensis]|uniref:histidine phosphatase family protein n=1 Tax=Legionella nagasakiensis TaxID=535290 RepID=UPI0010542307|nr:histidine phosphatase family protein [Legionella nagasakiensis]
MLKSLLSIVFGFFVYTCTFAQGKLIFAIDVVRHGDRTPITPSAGMEKIWPQGIGQLTPEGMRQEYNLGKALRQRYVNEYHLLPKHYKINTMNVRSSGIARTLMSAQSILFGLYPLGTGPFLNDSTRALPEGFQPIPINTVPPDQDSLLVPDHDKKLSKRLLGTYIFNSQEWIQKDRVLKSHYSAWSKMVGFQINNLFDLIYVSDRLFIERLYNIPLPNGLSEKDADTITEAGKWAWLYIYNHPTLALIAGNELAQKIKREINFAASCRESLKYLLFVAHDSTLAAQLKLLGQTIDDIPPYASQLNYSLFDMGSSTFEVRVTYNQKPLLIKQCDGDSCSLNDFINLIEKLNNEANTISKNGTYL